MALVFANLVAEIASATGTGSFYLKDAVSTQYSRFILRIPAGSKVVYTARQGSLYEIGYGVLVSDHELTRVAVFDSSTSIGMINSATAGSPSFVSFDSATDITVYNDVPAQLFVQLDETGNLVSGTPFRKAVTVDTITAMQALQASSTSAGEAVIVLGTDGNGSGIFRWNPETSTAADNVLTFRSTATGISSVGLWTKQFIDAQNTFDGVITNIAPSSGTGAKELSYQSIPTASTPAWWQRWVDTTNNAWRWSGNVNQSGLKNFLSMFSLGNAQDRIEANVPFVQASVTDSTGLKARSLAWLSGVSRLVFARADASSASSTADYREIPLTKGGYIVAAVKDIYDLKQIDPTSNGSGFSDYDMAMTRGSNSTSSDSGHTLTGNVEPAFWYWLSSSAVTEDLANVVRPSVGSAASGNGRWIREVSDITAGGTFTSGVAQPTVKNGAFFITNGTTTITALKGGYEGQQIVIQFGGTESQTLILTHNPDASSSGTVQGMNLGGSNITLSTSNPRVTLILAGGIWYSTSGGAPNVSTATGTLAIANGGTGATTATGASSNFQYLTGLSGGAARTYQSKFSDWVSVKDFGAVGDGSTDDTTAIQAALTAIATGGALFFPAGTYVLSSQLTCTLSPSTSAVSIMIAGAGADVTKLVWAGGGGLKINYANIIHGAHIRDMSFFTGTTATGSAIWLNQTASSTPNGGNSAITSLDNITIRGSDSYGGSDYWSNGVLISNVSNVNMYNCDITGSNTGGTGHGVGININGASSNDAVQFDLTSCVVNYFYQGILYNSYVEGVSIVSLNSIGCQYTIMSNGSESNLLQLTVVNSQINSNLYGIYTQSVINVLQINNNLFIIPVGASGSPSIGINCDYAGLFVINNNLFIPAGSSVNNYGVQITSNLTYPGIISNNIFHSLSLGIALLSSSKNVNATKNQFYSCGTTIINSGTGNIVDESSSIIQGSVTTTLPSSPVTGQLYFNTTSNTLQIYGTDSAWHSILLA